MTRLVDARAPSHITKERIKLLRRMEGETCEGQVLVVVAIKVVDCAGAEVEICHLNPSIMLQ